MSKIITYPNPILRKRSEEVGIVDDEMKQFLSHMARMMYKYDGIGLAAPQIGVNKRVIVIDPGKGLLKMANPKILEVKGDFVVEEEGCLSFPGVYVDVPRRIDYVVVSALDADGKERIWKGSGLFARVVQHEIDHLNGKVIIDYVSDKNKLSNGSKKALKKLEDEYARMSE